MQKKRYILFAVIGIIVLLVAWLGFTYNSLVKKDQNVINKWADVQLTYQRRLDLIPNLITVVKGLSDFEQTTLEKIAAARKNAMITVSSEPTAENYEKERVLQDSLAVAANRVIAVIEKYPALKGTEAYSGLQVQLEGTERRIAVARRDFNEAVAEYNKMVRSIGAGPVAGLFGFKVKKGFEASAGSEKAVQIKF